MAAGGVFLLAILAPFEMTRPLVRLPWQSLSNLEAALLASCAAWGVAAVWSARGRSWSALPAEWIDVPLAAAWLAFVIALAVASVAAPSERMNAWHMTGRVAAAGVVYLLTVSGITNRSRLRLALSLTVGTGVVVALFVLLEYVHVAPVLRALQLFRPSVTAVGAQVRAGGPLQYPTIASMYLEVVFAFGLGLMLTAIDQSQRRRAVLWFVALVAIAEAITLTFTRAGLITVATSLLMVGAARWRQRGADRGAASLAALALLIAALLLGSRSSQSLWLRMTSEGQDAWYRAQIEAPADLAFGVDETRYVTVTIANTGRLVWDSTAEPPVLFSYHWLDENGARVVTYEGKRTAFGAPVAPGATATVRALVRAPRHPGRYQLHWDVVQEGRLWFSTEQAAPDPVTSMATVTGVASGSPLPTSALPRRSLRPGRLVLWRTASRMIAAHPLTGVGPDNFRLLYGGYAGLAEADRRTHSNNMYLEVVVGGGVLALAAFAWLLRGAYRLFVSVCLGSDPRQGGSQVVWGQTPDNLGIAAAGVAIALHGMVDSFLSFAPTYILFSLTLGFAAAVARGAERPDAHRV